MVDRQERQQRMGEIREWEGLEEREGVYERRSARAETELADEGRMVGHRRGSSEGIMRSGSEKNVERGAARKEVRWSKDVDYEG